MIRYEITDRAVLKDHSQLRRSGHLGHALVEYAPGKILSFYSDSAGGRMNGHSGYGWVEYRRSCDAGKTWDEGRILPYSMETFLDGACFIACEKAVSPRENVIVLACLRCLCDPCWEPYLEPTVLVSCDGGETWGEPTLLSPYAGRTYDMIARDGVIYALHFCNDAKNSFTGNLPEHVYRLYTSRDAGETWHEESVLPFDAIGRGYGAMEFLPDGSLIAYVYNINDEFHADYVISRDLGITWEAPAKIRLAKRIRNPQIVRAGGAYFMHGRSGCMDHSLPCEFVLYTSPDGITWDEGSYIDVTPDSSWGDHGYYSNSISLGESALVQYSKPYDEARTNVCSLTIGRIRAEEV